MRKAEHPEVMGMLAHAVRSGERALQKVDEKEGRRMLAGQGP